MWSMRRQTLSEIEIVVVDDGSTDRSAAVLDRHAKHDPRVQVVRQTNQGLVPALNAGLAVARGPYIARMDADDVAWPSRLAKQVAHLEAHADCVAVGCWVRTIDPGGWPIRTWHFPVDHEALVEAMFTSQAGHCIPHPGLMVRRDAFDRIGGYHDAFTWAEDLDLYLRLSEIGRLGNVPDVLLDYRVHLTNVTRMHATIQADQAYAAVVKACHRHVRPVPAQKLYPAHSREESLSQLRESWWWHARHHGYYHTSLHQTLCHLKRHPWSLRWWKRGVGDLSRWIGASSTVH